MTTAGPADTACAGTPSAPRLHLVDYSRGVLALFVMVYHYTLFGGYHGHGSVVLAKLGIYAVGAFYVTSGISFGYVYRSLQLRLSDLREFAIKRFFRLAPVYWIAMAASLVLAPSTTIPAWRLARSVLLNLTFAFGVLRPTAYIPGGGWSIGNEVCFYLLFPAFIVLLRRSRVQFAALFAASLGIAAWYGWHILRPDASLADQWAWYIRPENHVFLFLAGVGVSWQIGKTRLSARATAATLLAVMAIFVLVPAGLDQITIVRGAPRFLYGTLAVAFCAAGALGQLPMPAIVERAMGWLGRTSYAIYLFHIPMHGVVTKMFGGARGAAATGWWVVPIAVAGTFVLSHLIYRHVEAPLIIVGKRLAEHLARRPAVPAVRGLAAIERTPAVAEAGKSAT